MRFLDDRGGFGAAGTRTGSWKAPGGGIAAGLAYSSAWELVWPRGVEGDAMLEASSSAARLVEAPPAPLEEEPMTPAGTSLEGRGESSPDDDPANSIGSAGRPVGRGAAAG